MARGDVIDASIVALRQLVCELAGDGAQVETCVMRLSEDPARRLRCGVWVTPSEGLSLRLQCYEPAPGEDTFARRGRFGVRYREVRVDAGEGAQSTGALETWLEGLRERLRRFDPASLEEALAMARPALERASPRAPEPGSFEPTGPRVSPMELGSESSFLTPLFDGYAAHFGQPPRVHATPVPGAFTIQYPAVSRNRVFLAAPTRFRSDARFVAYLRQLGFVTDEDLQLRTVPTPASFLKLRQARQLGSSGFIPRLMRHRRLVLPVAEWLELVAGGVFPLNVAAADAYRIARPVARLASNWEPLRALIDTHLHALGHDMGMHILLTHRVPPDAVHTLGAKVKAEMNGLRLRVGPLAPEPLAAFYEEDLTAHCLAIWESVEHPAAFEDAYREREMAVWQSLESRITELREGVRGGMFVDRVARRLRGRAR